MTDASVIEIEFHGPTLRITGSGFDNERKQVTCIDLSMVWCLQFEYRGADYIQVKINDKDIYVPDIGLENCEKIYRYWTSLKSGAQA